MRASLRHQRWCVDRQYSYQHMDVVHTPVHHAPPIARVVLASGCHSGQAQPGADCRQTVNSAYHHECVPSMTCSPACRPACACLQPLTVDLPQQSQLCHSTCTLLQACMLLTHMPALLTNHPLHRSTALSSPQLHHRPPLHTQFHSTMGPLRVSSVSHGAYGAYGATLCIPTVSYRHALLHSTISLPSLHT
jgi:hypothetical protein